MQLSEILARPYEDTEIDTNFVKMPKKISL